MTTPRLNRTELERVKGLIQTDAEGFDMGDWGLDIYTGARMWEKEECGTALCIAGHALLGQPRPPFDGVRRADLPEAPAMKILGIPDARLFYADKWPKWALWEYENKPQAAGQAQAAIALIDDILARGYLIAMDKHATDPRERRVS